jgi:hypothetical protein
VLIFCGIPTSLCADNVRGPVSGLYSVLDGAEPSPIVRLSSEDLFLVSLGGPHDLLAAVDIHLEIPRQALEDPGSFALYVYDELQPDPAPTRRDYRGRQALLKPLGDQSRLTLRIVLNGSGASLPSAPGSIVLKFPRGAAGSPWAFTILPIMKGLPDSAQRWSFPIQARPVFRNLGKVGFLVNGPDGALAADGYSVRIDEKPVSTVAPLLLEPGLYKAKIEAPGLMPEQLTVMVEKGRSIILETRLRKPYALFKLDAPPSAKAFLDGKEIDLTRRGAHNIEAGEHNLTVILGDYQVSRRFTAQVERSYTFNVFFDILMKEN